MRETFGAYIRKLRTNKHYTLTQLAAKLGIDSSTLSKVETGKKSFDENLLGLLSELFDLDEKTVKNEYYSEIIARIIFNNNCSEDVLSMAAQKTVFLRNKNVIQANMNF